MCLKTEYQTHSETEENKEPQKKPLNATCGSPMCFFLSPELSMPEQSSVSAGGARHWPLGGADGAAPGAEAEHREASVQTMCRAACVLRGGNNKINDQM